MTTQVQPRVAPEGFPGSLPEFLVFEMLVRLGKDPDTDFTFQSPFMGGRLQRGGVIIDFLFSNPPNLAFNVQGIFFHYAQGSETRARDVMARQQMAGLGIQLIFIDEDDILADTRFFVEEALAFRDHSRLSR